MQLWNRLDFVSAKIYLFDEGKPNLNYLYDDIRIIIEN